MSKKKVTVEELQKKVRELKKAEERKNRDEMHQKELAKRFSMLMRSQTRSYNGEVTDGEDRDRIEVR